MDKTYMGGRCEAHRRPEGFAGRLTARVFIFRLTCIFERG
jgi:hypothetical protein